MGHTSLVGRPINSMEILAGRNTDALVAEHVLKWRRFPVAKDINGKNAGEVLCDRDPTQLNGFALPSQGLLHVAYFCRQWSTDLAAAITLATELGMELEMGRSRWPERGRFWAGVAGEYGAFADTIPLAIARAALARARYCW